MHMLTLETDDLREQPTYVNGSWPMDQTMTTRADEISKLLQSTLDQLKQFVSKADQEQDSHRLGAGFPTKQTSLVVPASERPKTLIEQLEKCVTITENGTGCPGFNDALREILQYSVNPMAPGFMDKLYSAPLPPGIATELALAVLNANLHVYHVSPVLTIIEKLVTKKLAGMFGLVGSRAGGISVQGGSASNLTSIVVARNSLFPKTKTDGNCADDKQLVMFTSAHGHYSIEKAAQALGFGSSAVIPVSTDVNGKMKPDELERLILAAKANGKTPFYVNATAGTTVLGSFDPFMEISQLAKRHRCWFHIDGAWGGSFIFSQKDEFRAKLQGTSLADSIAINPHKMLGVPVTCSLLLTRDLRLFQTAMTLKAGYLFHEDEDQEQAEQADERHTLNGSIANDEIIESKDLPDNNMNGHTSLYDLRDTEDPSWVEPDDLADMTMQCGRRADSLKFFMSWQYYGTDGYARMIENAYDIATYMSKLVSLSDDLTLLLGPDSKPSCLQVCFYYTPNSQFVFGINGQPGLIRSLDGKSDMMIGKLNTKVTSRISKALVPRGFMVDFAPALEGQEDRGSFLRVVVNISTIRETVERLVNDVLSVGKDVVRQLEQEADIDHGQIVAV